MVCPPELRRTAAPNLPGPAAPAGTGDPAGAGDPAGTGALAPLDPRLSVAPMMDRTDRHFRVLARILTRRTLLYTEMISTGALLHGDAASILDHDAIERPLAAQLGGDDPRALARCARLVEDQGFDEVNLNAGCPSDRVRRGRFGACLMLEPGRVADAVASMRAAVRIPVTVKHRIGVDDRDAYDDLARFVATVAAAGCTRFIVHARKAWLQGLSPRQNRTVPPLRHGDVHRLARAYPRLSFVLNGGITSLEEAARNLEHVAGVMLGRAAYENPYVLARADRVVFGEEGPAPPSRAEVVSRWSPYVERGLARGERLGVFVHHLQGLFHGRPGARAWRRRVGEWMRARRGDFGEVERAAAAIDRTGMAASRPAPARG